MRRCIDTGQEAIPVARGQLREAAGIYPVRSVTSEVAARGILEIWMLYLRARQAALRKERDAINAAFAPAGKNAGPIQGTGSGG
jgi:hypothetical protein